MGTGTLILKSTVAAILSILVGIVFALLSSDAPYVNVDWRIKTLDFAFKGLSQVCGMNAGDRYGKTVFGTDWRPCFETMRPSARTGEWGGVRSLDLDIPYGVFTPVDAARSNALLPTLVLYHGGGWTISHYNDMEYDSLARQLSLDGGWLVVHPEYPLAPEHPFPSGLRASYNALAFVSSNAGVHPSLLQSDPSRIFVGGDSAGGNIAAVMALLARDGVDVDGLSAVSKIDVAHQLLVYPGLYPPGDHTSSEVLHAKAPILNRSIRDFFTKSYLGLNAGELKKDWRVSPLRAISHSGLPPATFVHAQFDPLRDEGIMYASKLRDANVKVVELDYEDVPHGFFTFLTLNIETTFRSIKEAADAVNKSLAVTTANAGTANKGINAGLKK